MHTKDLIKRGVAIEKLSLLQAWREAGQLFTAKEQAVLAWTESVTNVADTGVPDAEFDNIKHLCTEKEIVDLTIAISLMNAYNRMAISFRNVAQSVEALQR